MINLSICESHSAIITHARVVGDEGMVYGGGLHNIHGKVALCGAKVSWDTSIPFRPESVSCRLCRSIVNRKEVEGGIDPKPRTYERVRDHFEAHAGTGTYTKREGLTCNLCAMVDRCCFAWDGYNTNGDCLGDK